MLGLDFAGSALAVAKKRADPTELAKATKDYKTLQFSRRER
jgi:hypothetical protein